MKERKHSRSGVSILLAVFLPALACEPSRPETHPRSDEAATRLANRAFENTLVLEDLRELCERFGARPTGTPSCERALDWAAEKFRAAGLDEVTLEPFPLPARWLPGKAEGVCLSPENFVFRLAAVPSSPSTPGGAPAVGELVDAGNGSLEAFTGLGARARDAIALVSSDETRNGSKDPGQEVQRNASLLAAVVKARPMAVLVESSRPGPYLRRQTLTSGPDFPVPAAVLPRAEFERLAALLRNGPVRVRITLVNETGPPYESRNVVAQIRGRIEPDSVVLLGAHLDSWDLGTGAQDDGVGAALVLDVARGMKALGLTPRRSVRFVLFTGEEQGRYGSLGYVRRHGLELDRHAAVVVFDLGSGWVQGFFLNGRKELREPVRRAQEGHPAFKSLFSLNAVYAGSDNLDFLLSGVPNLVARQDLSHYVDAHHSEADVFSRVDPESVRWNTAVAAVVVWGLAEGTGLPARRQTREEVEALLLRSGLGRDLKLSGLRSFYSAPPP